MPNDKKEMKLPKFEMEPEYAAKIKEEAFPATTLPGQWTAKGAGLPAWRYSCTFATVAGTR